ncbi:hypothetical protein [Alistipes sp. ZOR0009]|uniref:hypothetical protein n=1 Tax=Alistipes sp. ZOR0009 TaxID=1339253 RepID=UPI000646CAB4|nr:hypothetical protein [Alistipes sp. ZOR0009]
MNKKNIIIEQYDALSNFLQKLSKEEIAELENGKKEIMFELKDKSKTSGLKILSFDEFVIQSIIDELNKMNSREDGLKLIVDKCSSRLDFEALAKKLDIPFTKKDTIEKLKDKIVEGTIGFRLRSQAIQDKQD